MQHRARKPSEALGPSATSGEEAFQGTWIQCNIGQGSLPSLMAHHKIPRGRLEGESGQCKMFKGRLNLDRIRPHLGQKDSAAPHVAVVPCAEEAFLARCCDWPMCRGSLPCPMLRPANVPRKPSSPDVAAGRCAKEAFLARSCSGSMCRGSLPRPMLRPAHAPRKPSLADVAAGRCAVEAF